MKIILSAIAIILCCLNTTHSYAAEAIPRKKIEKVLKSYVNSVGCLVSFDRSNIVKIGETFVAFYDIDQKCSGGSRSYEPALAVLEYDFEREPDLIVIPERSFPAAKLFGFPQNISKIYIQNGEIWYAGKEYNGGKDADCCPSIDIKAKFSLQKETIFDSKYAKDINSYYGYKMGIESWYWIDSRIVTPIPNPGLKREAAEKRGAP